MKNSPNLIIVLIIMLLTSTVTTISCHPKTDISNLNGVWQFKYKVTKVTGNTTIELGQESIEEITITQNGEELTFFGFAGSSNNQIKGWVKKIVSIGSPEYWFCEVNGKYTENGGIVTGVCELKINSANEMSGIWNWGWFKSDRQPFNIDSSVTATRISGL